MLLLLDQGVVSVSSFLAMVLVGRACGDRELGTYGVAYTLMWLSASIPYTLIWIPYTNRAPLLIDSRRIQYTKNVAIHVVCFCALMTLPTALVVWTLSNGSMKLWLGIYLFVVGMTLREHVRRVKIANLEFHRLLAVDLPVAFLQLFALGLAAMREILNVESALSILGAISMLPFLIEGVAFEPMRWHRQSVFRDFQRNWKVGRWLVGSSLIGASCDSVYRFMIVQLLGIAQFGQFTAAFSLPMFANPVVMTCGNYLRVILARDWIEGGTRRIRERLHRSIFLFGFLGVLMFGTVAFLGEFGAEFAFGSKYRGLGLLISTLCAALWISMVTVPSEVVLTVIGRGRTLIYTTLLRLLIMIVAGFPLIYFLGLIGGAMALAVGFLCQCIAQTAIADRYLKQKESEVSSGYSPGAI